MKAKASDVKVVDVNGAVGHFQEPEERQSQGGLPCPCSAHDSNLQKGREVVVMVVVVVVVVSMLVFYAQSTSTVISGGGVR